MTDFIRLYLGLIRIRLFISFSALCSELEILYKKWIIIYKLWSTPYDDLKIILSDYKKSYFQDPDFTFLWMQNWRQKKSTLIWWYLPWFYLGTSICDFHMCLKKIEGLYYTEGIEWDNFYLLELEFLLDLDWAEHAIHDGFQCVITFFVVYVMSMFFWVVKDTFHEFDGIILYGFSELLLDDNELAIDHILTRFFVTTDPFYVIFFFILAIPLAVISGQTFDWWGAEYEAIEEFLEEEQDQVMSSGDPELMYFYEYERTSEWGDVKQATEQELLFADYSYFVLAKKDLPFFFSTIYVDYLASFWHEAKRMTRIRDFLHALNLKIGLDNHIWKHYRMGNMDPVEDTVISWEDFIEKDARRYLDDIPIPNEATDWWDYKNGPGLVIKYSGIQYIKKSLPKWKVSLFFKLINNKKILKLKGPEIWDPKIKEELDTFIKHNEHLSFVTYPTIGLFFNVRELKENVTNFSYYKTYKHEDYISAIQQRKRYFENYFTYARLYKALKWQYSNIFEMRKRKKLLKKSKHSVYVWMYYKRDK